MLSKLLKHELRATGRIFLPLYLLLVVFTAINRFFVGRGMQGLTTDEVGTFGATMSRFIEVASITLYCIIIVAIFIMTLVVTVMRFYKNLLGEEGYLMNTLPVTVDQHILSKLLVSLLWQILSALVACLSIFILIVNRDFFKELNELKVELMLTYSQWAPHVFRFSFETILLFLVSAVSSVLVIYAAIMVGSQASKHRLLASFGVYIGFGIAANMITSMVSGIFAPQLQNFFDSLDTVDTEVVLQMFHFVFISGIIFSIIEMVVFYFLTRHMLKKRLNLD